MTIERADSPPRVDVLREAPLTLRADPEGDEADGRTLDGYAAVFNRETIINSWEGKFREKLSPGSMKKSFREKPPRIQFDHGRHPLVGSIPIAQVRSITEDTDPVLAPEGGAHIVARLHDNWLVEPVREAIASGSIDGMSFRFDVVQERWFDHTGKQIRDEQTLMEMLRRSWYEDVPDDELLLRDLREIKVPELGPVVWPAYQDTSVAVRSKTVTVDLGRLDDPEQRKTLARAVFLADAAERMTTDEESQTTDEPEDLAGEHDEPRATESDESSAGERTEVVENDEPQVTEEPPADKHPSMSRSRMQAELALLTGHIDAAERYEAQSMRRQLP